MACEALIILKYNDTVIANLLGTPSDIHELMLGHLACEGYVMPDMELILESLFEIVLDHSPVYAPRSIIILSEFKL